MLDVRLFCSVYSTVSFNFHRLFNQVRVLVILGLIANLQYHKYNGSSTQNGKWIIKNFPGLFVITLFAHYSLKLGQCSVRDLNEITQHCQSTYWRSPSYFLLLIARLHDSSNQAISTSPEANEYSLQLLLECVCCYQPEQQFH